MWQTKNMKSTLITPRNLTEKEPFSYEKIDKKIFSCLFFYQKKGKMSVTDMIFKKSGKTLA